MCVPTAFLHRKRTEYQHFAGIVLLILAVHTMFLTEQAQCLVARLDLTNELIQQVHSGIHGKAAVMTITVNASVPHPILCIFADEVPAIRHIYRIT